MTTTALAVKNPSEFALFSFDDKVDAIRELIQENLGAETFRPSELDRIKVPSGGGTTFSIPTINGEEEVKELECIVLMVKQLRLFYRTSFEETGEGTPPDCMSVDGLNGFGDPGGYCLECPFQKFDNELGRSECNEKRNMFILPANVILPYVLSVPQMSIKPMKDYIMRLTQVGQKVSHITTKVTLVKTKNKRGIPYSELRFTKMNDLSEDQIVMVENYNKSFARVIDATQRAETGMSSGGMPNFDEEPAY